jgi:hypothetical protein
VIGGIVIVKYQSCGNAIVQKKLFLASFDHGMQFIILVLLQFDILCHRHEIRSISMIIDMCGGDNAVITWCQLALVGGRMPILPPQGRAWPGF